MKKKLLFISVLLVLVWAVGFFIMGFSFAVHTMLWVSLILLLRSCLICNESNVAVAKDDK